MANEVILTNKAYDTINEVTVSIITPVFNRTHTLERTLQSVKNQTFKDFEHIIVDDGSTDNPDTIIQKYMDEVDFPVMFIKKENGGVHTARNSAIRKSKGAFLIFLDSDDEIVPNNLEKFLQTWNNIPVGQRHLYREIVAKCQDQDGNLIGQPFPENINELSKDEARNLVNSQHVEHTALLVASTVRDCLWPEPEGVTFVTEGLVWIELNKTYKGYYINEPLRIYHMDGNDNLSNFSGNKKSIQKIKNNYWNENYLLSTTKVTPPQKIKNIFQLDVYARIIRSSGDREFIKKYPIVGGWNKFIAKLLYLPACLFAIIYKKKKM